MANYIKGNLLNVFVSVKTKVGEEETVAWKFFAYTQSSGLTISNNLQSISSKDHGNYNDKILQESTFEISNECYATVDNLKMGLEMARDGKEYSFAFVKVAEPESAGVTGLSGVTGVGDVSTWTPGTDVAYYGNGMVSNAQVTSQTGEMGSMSLTITGLGGLATTAQTGDRLKSYVKA